MQRTGFAATGWMLMACLLLAASASAQVNPIGGFDAATFGAPAADEAVVAASAVLVAPADGKPALLYVVADVAPGWHIYSLTQEKGGPLPTKITLQSQDVKLLEPFAAVTPPENHNYPDLWKGVTVEEHSGSVVWRAPVEVARGVDPQSLLIHGAVTAMACASSCLPSKDYPFTARLGDAPAVPARKEERGAPPDKTTFRRDNLHTSLSGHLRPAVAKPGEKVELVLAASPDAGYHTYSYSAQPPESAIGPRPTLIVVDEGSQLRASTAKADSDAVDKPDATGESHPYHDRPVQWTIELTVPQGASPGRHLISGMIGFQSCSDANCDFPAAARFSGELAVGDSSAGGQVPLTFEEAKYAQVSERLKSTPTRAAAAPVQDVGSVSLPSETPPGLWYFLVLSFLGGIILNVMPCVLPVIGLKILSFVEQSHHDRRRIFLLNAAYSLGVVSLMLVLATLVVALHFTWGEQNQSTAYNVTMAAIIFAMGLSLLGVWEIPIPGFFTSKRASEAAAQEGYIGAFAKGIVTTVLATSCIAPLLGTAVGWAVNQSPAVIYATFALAGLGLAFPYLIIGAFPVLVRFLPKPGMWMDTFKQLMGFVLLGTVIWILTYVGPAIVVPTVAFIFCVWAACWWIGRTPWTEPAGKKLLAWGQAAAFLVAAGWFSFSWLEPYSQKQFQARVSREIDRRQALVGDDSDELLLNPDRGPDDLRWLPFSEARLARLLAEGKTVMIDVTADWCGNCKWLEKYVLNTPPVKSLVESNGVVPLVADFTDQDNPVIKALLARLGSGGVPVLAIYPAGSKQPSTVFKDLYRAPALLDALRSAGPSSAAKDQLSSAAAGRRGS